MKRVEKIKEKIKKNHPNQEVEIKVVYAKNT